MAWRSATLKMSVEMKRAGGQAAGRWRTGDERQRRQAAKHQAKSNGGQGEQRKNRHTQQKGGRPIKARLVAAVAAWRIRKRKPRKRAATGVGAASAAIKSGQPGRREYSRAAYKLSRRSKAQYSYQAVSKPAYLKRNSKRRK